MSLIKTMNNIKTKKQKRIWRGISILFIVISICAFYNGLTIKTYYIKTSKINKERPVRIVLISDLHSTIYGKDQQPLIQKVKAENPDLILLAGDIADDLVPIEGTKLFLDGVCGVAPVYYVTGNHEYWSGDIKAICDEIQSYGVKVLSDKYEQIEINGNKLIVAGIDDPDKVRYGWPDYNQTEEMDKAFEYLNYFDVYKILLAHRPERVEYYAEYSFDLVLSGHAHGGQARIPFVLNGIFAPNQGFFPKYAGGLYKHNDLIHIVSRGTSINPRLPRVFNPPEIAVIILSSQ